MAARLPFDSLYAHGFVRLAAIAPRVSPADPARNGAEISRFLREADAAKAAKSAKASTV